MQPRPLLATLAILLLVSSPSVAKEKERVVYSFGATQADAQTPYGGLIADKAGNLYGTSFGGGTFHSGTVFMLGENGAETIIHSFQEGPSDGARPRAALTMDKSGNLFGTTTRGGTTSSGVIFELSPNGTTYTEKVLYNFCSLPACADSGTTRASLTIGPKGEIYGTTPQGGQGAVEQNDGVVFRLDPPRKGKTNWTETVLYAFCNEPSCTDGSNPNGAPLLADDGFLYGTTSAGGQGGGVFYRVKSSGGDFQILHTFLMSGEDGYLPSGSLSADSADVIYGTTGLGGSGPGSNGNGTAFSFDPKSSVYKKIFDFHGSDGGFPDSALTIIETKKMTAFFGTSSAGYGSLYSLTPPENSGDPWSGQLLYTFCSKEFCADGGDTDEDKVAVVNGSVYGTTVGGGQSDFGTVFKFGKK